MQSRTNYCPVIFKEKKEKNKKNHLSLWETRGLIDFLLIIIIWTIIIVVNVIIIAVVIITSVNVKEMYTSHGLFCSPVENVFFHSYLSSLSQSFSLFVSCAKLSFLLSFTLV